MTEGQPSSGDDFEKASRETVLLDQMSGYEFEDFFARVLDRLGYGRIEQVLYSRDEGRDILVRSPQGLMVVECKHQPGTSIGRPVVQKLHSAVVSSKAARGMLVTTGHFSKAALEFSDKLAAAGTPIDMVDHPLLMDMAARAGIAIVSSSGALGVWTYAIPPPIGTRTELANFLRTRVESHPRPPGALIRECKREIQYRPFFIVIYDVDAVFSTSVGLLHHEKVTSAWIAVDGNTGETHSSSDVKYLNDEVQVPFRGTSPEFTGELAHFQVNQSDLRRIAKTTIGRMHTRTITYTGRNNQTYSKVCEPGDRDIHIRDVREVYVPYERIVFQLLHSAFHADAFHAPSGRLWVTRDDLGQCGICHSHIPGTPLLCDACGRVTHQGGFFLGSAHGFRCRRCQRTTCRAHGYWQSRLLVFKTYFCLWCASEAKKEGKKVTPLGPLKGK